MVVLVPCRFQECTKECYVSLAIVIPSERIIVPSQDNSNFNGMMAAVTLKETSSTLHETDL